LFRYSNFFAIAAYRAHCSNEGMTSDLAELRALVIDDNVDAATSLSYLLQLLGCKTAVDFGGVMGLRVAQLFSPAIVFLDLDMPGQDGCDVLAELKSLPGPGKDALFVCLTGRSEPNDELRCLSAGFDRFVSKPMEADTLRVLLETAQNRIGVASGPNTATTTGEIPGR
jgi:CheY-like chemotaxis protein